MKKTQMYTKLAKYYDKMHHFFDYKGQVEFIIDQFEKHNKSGKKKVLDVACGTGNHANLLVKRGFDVTGIDISKDMLKQAKKKDKRIRYLLRDMKDFKLNERFDMIICMFNSILYNLDKNQLKKTFRNFYTHLEKGGILIFESFDKQVGINLTTFLYNKRFDDLHIVSVYITRYNKKEDILEFDNYFIINGELVRDCHKAGAFTHKDFINSIESAGFEIIKTNKNVLRKNDFTHKYVCIK